MLREAAISPVGCTTKLLHHNNPHQSGLSLMRPHGNRASSVSRRWRGKAAKKGGRRSDKRRKRWGENRYLPLFTARIFKIWNSFCFEGRRERERERQRDREMGVGQPGGDRQSGVQGWGGGLAGPLLLSPGPGSAAPRLCSAEPLC